MNKNDDSFNTLIPFDVVLIYFYKYVWILCLSMALFFLYGYSDYSFYGGEYRIIWLVMGVLFLILIFILTNIFKRALYSIVYNNKILKQISYKFEREIIIGWEDIVSIERHYKFAPKSRVIKSINGTKIKLWTEDKGYKELMELLKSKAINLRNG